MEARVRGCVKDDRPRVADERRRAKDGGTECGEVLGGGKTHGTREKMVGAAGFEPTTT